MDAEISPQNQDVLLQIASLIHLAEGFRLGFVKCNQPVQCRQLAAKLTEMLAGEAKIIDVELKHPTQSLRASVLKELETNNEVREVKRVIMVFGFEHSISSNGPAPALDELNQSRDLFPGSFSCPILIWLPDYALTRLAREAPDFWGWRSGVFEFEPEFGLMISIENTIMQDEAPDRLNLAEKKERVAALEGLIRDYQEMQRGERENRALAVVFDRLGLIRYQMGEYGKARRLYEQSLKIAQDLGNKDDVSITLHQLGLLAQDIGDLAEARHLYEQSLKIKENLGDRNGVSKTLHQLGMLAQDMGDLAEARRLYEQSLKIKEDLGDRSGVSITLHQLGLLAQNTGDLAEARRLYEQSLKIAQDLGDKSGESITLHQLGNMAYLVGDLAEARRLYEQSLKIKEDLGDKRGIAITIAQYSLLEEIEGHIDKALNLIIQAEAFFLELKSPMAARARNDRERLENKLSRSKST